MFCSNCGREIADGSRFCSACGAPQTSEVQEFTPKLRVIRELNGIKFDALKLAMDTGFLNHTFTSTDTQLALKKLTGASAWKISRMISDLKRDDELKEAVKKRKAEIADAKQAEGMRCPNCQSKNIEIHQKGFSAGKALVGGLLTGGIGLVAGFHGRKQLIAHCLNCGHDWKV